MDKAELLDLILKRVATGSIPASTVRGMGPKGTMEQVQASLSKRALITEFSTVKTQVEFNELLERATLKLAQELPLGTTRYGKTVGRHWGTARKCLNIFLLECVLNRYLCEDYGLAHLEPWLEVPLDSLVGSSLAKETENTSEFGPLWWDTVVGLKKEKSDSYQELARRVASHRGIYPIQLELYYYHAKWAVNDQG